MKRLTVQERYDIIQSIIDNWHDNFSNIKAWIIIDKILNDRGIFLSWSKIIDLFYINDEAYTKEQYKKINIYGR